jgi:hypothetical protein
VTLVGGVLRVTTSGHHNTSLRIASNVHASYPPGSATRVDGILYAGTTGISFIGLAVIWLRNYVIVDGNIVCGNAKRKVAIALGVWRWSYRRWH